MKKGDLRVYFWSDLPNWPIRRNLHTGQMKQSSRAPLAEKSERSLNRMYVYGQIFALHCIHSHIEWLKRVAKMN